MPKHSFNATFVEITSIPVQLDDRAATIDIKRVRNLPKATYQINVRLTTKHFSDIDNDINAAVLETVKNTLIEVVKDAIKDRIKDLSGLRGDDPDQLALFGEDDAEEEGEGDEFTNEPAPEPEPEKVKGNRKRG